MGAYFQTQIHKETLDPKHLNQFSLIDDVPATIIDKQVIGYEWCNFEDCSAYLYPEHNSIYQWLTVNSSKDQPVKVATVCDYDADFKEAFFKYESTKREGIRSYLPKKKSDFAIKGYLVCDNTKQYISLEAISGAAFRGQSDSKSLVSPLALLTRFSNNNQGGGDIDFTKIDLNTLWLVSAWYNQLIYYTEDKPKKHLQDITQDVVCYF